MRVSTARPFVGRQTELTFLHRAAGAATDERPTLIFLHGRSGLGKSTLAHQFLDELRVTNPDTIILRARCYEQESVPYKGLDNLIDSLVQYLRSVPALELESILPRELHALEQLFPVMREIASQVTPRRPLQVTDPWEFRRRGARALRELLARLSDLRRIVLFVDDGHWGDMDSARLLQDILRPPDAPPLLLLISYRTEEAGSNMWRAHEVCLSAVTTSRA